MNETTRIRHVPALTEKRGRKGHLVLLALALFLALPSTAQAGTAITRLEFCDDGDFCRYFPNARLTIAFVDPQGERNELALTQSGGDFRIRDGRAPIALDGDFCDALSDREVRCGPRPIPGSTVGIDTVTLTALTGAGNDSVWVDAGSADLGPGNDSARGHGLVAGGPGKDDIRALGPPGIFLGGSGEDVLGGHRAGDDLRGGAGPDLLLGEGGRDDLAGGRGRDAVAGGTGRDDISAGPGNDIVRSTDPDRDTVRCGPGTDRAYVSGRDRVAKDCERVTFGWPR